MYKNKILNINKTPKKYILINYLHLINGNGIHLILLQHIVVYGRRNNIIQFKFIYKHFPRQKKTN